MKKNRSVISALCLCILFAAVQTSPAAPVYTFNARAKLINGTSKNRVNIVTAGEGFAAADTSKFPGWADSNITYRRGLSSVKNNIMVMRPFPRYDKFFNWYIVNLVSPESGISVEGGTTVNNAIGGTRDNDRVGYVNQSKSIAMFSEAEQSLGVKLHWHQVVLNLNGYYNSGNPGLTLAVFAFPNWGDIACHEAGHGFNYLADEYSGPGTDTREYVEINSTADPRAPKWAHWIGYRDIDTKLDTMGVYQGSRYATTGQYRPSKNSKMNGTGQNYPTSFNAICREKIIHDIYDIVKPIDTLMSTAETARNPDSVWVRVIDPAVLKVDWYVNNLIKKRNGGTSIKKAEIAATTGTYTVKAHVYDECIRHAYSSNTNPDTLDLVRKDTAKMVQDVQWTVLLTAAAALNNAISAAGRDLTCDVSGNTVTFTLRQAGDVLFSVFGIDGSLVQRTVVYATAGKNTRQLAGNGRNSVPAGMYLVRLSTGAIMKTLMVLVR